MYVSFFLSYRKFPGVRKCANNLKLILLGSNDSSLPCSGTGQHVHLESYKDNLRKIITDPIVASHHPTILLVTPPPINELHLEEEDLKKGFPSLTRHQSVTAQYAEAVRELVEELQSHNVLLVDLWTAIMKEAAKLTPDLVEGAPMLGTKAKGDSWALRSLLVDGIHLSPTGYAVFLREVLPVVAPSLDESNKDHQPWVFPYVVTGFTARTLLTSPQALVRRS